MRSPPPFPILDWSPGISAEYQKGKKGDNLKLLPEIIGPYEVVATFGSHTYQLERLGQTKTQNECRLKLYQAFTERRGQTPRILENKGCRTPDKTTKTETQPPKHLEKYIEIKEVKRTTSATTRVGRCS